MPSSPTPRCRQSRHGSLTEKCDRRLRRKGLFFDRVRVRVEVRRRNPRAACSRPRACSMHDVSSALNFDGYITSMAHLPTKQATNCLFSPAVNNHSCCPEQQQRVSRSKRR